MREIRMKARALVDSAVREPGDVLSLDDHRAARLVALGHAEFVTRLATPPAVPAAEQATRKPVAERAIARK